MGLDLYHVIPSVKTDRTHEYFTPDELKEHPLFIQNHSHLFTEVEEPVFGFEILVFPDKRTRDILIKSSEYYENKPVVIGNINRVTNKLKKLAKRNSISSNEPMIFKHDDLIQSKKYSREVYHHSASYKTGSRKATALYWETIGYQRKRMNPKFYEDFNNCELYFDKSSVLKAANYLDPVMGETEEELKSSFQKNFIDNFIEGKSVFFGSW